MSNIPEQQDQIDGLGRTIGILEEKLAQAEKTTRETENLMKACRGASINPSEVEKLPELQAELDRLTRLMPHRCETCTWEYRTRCTHSDYVSPGDLKIDSFCIIDKWELEE